MLALIDVKGAIIIYGWEAVDKMVAENLFQCKQIEGGGAKFQCIESHMCTHRYTLMGAEFECIAFDGGENVVRDYWARDERNLSASDFHISTGPPPVN